MDVSVIQTGYIFNKFDKIIIDIDLSIGFRL